MQKITILKVSENMADAAVGKWYIAEGAPLKKGDLVVDLITEKATFEIEAEQDGILLKQYATSKSIVPVGFTVALVGNKDEEIPPEIETANEKLLKGPEINIVKESAAAYNTSSGVKIKATPAARRKAKAAGIDLTEIKEALDISGVLTEKHIDDYIKRSP